MFPFISGALPFVYRILVNVHAVAAVNVFLLSLSAKVGFSLLVVYQMLWEILLNKEFTSTQS